MHAHALSENVRLTLVEAATAAGTTDIESAGVDMSDWEGVMLFTTVGTITSGAVTSWKVQQSDDDGVTDAYSDLEGTGITIADDDDGQTFGTDLYRPKKRYVRAYIDRGTQNAVVGEIYALRYNGLRLPATNTVADTLTLELHVSPAEGTA